MAEAGDAKGVYMIKWEKKPLGFSIVMDTTGKNAYVSSIQSDINRNKGLKLAAQIVAINGTNQRDRKHTDILQSIKSAQLPITLKFQPRSFANDPKDDDELTDIPKVLTFKGAPASNAHRVNGYFELIKEKINDKHVWQRKDAEKDPILVWYWPNTKSNLDKSLWMIGRKSYVNKQGAYACVDSEVDIPTEVNKTWKAYDQSINEFVDAKIVIDQNNA